MVGQIVQRRGSKPLPYAIHLGNKIQMVNNDCRDAVAPHLGIIVFYQDLLVYPI